jgi:large-conductance mechanosensitive channel
MPAGTYDAAYNTYGEFINDLINFLVLAFVVYFVVKALKLDIKK